MILTRYRFLRWLGVPRATALRIAWDEWAELKGSVRKGT